jgi:hypothetical protein
VIIPALHSLWPGLFSLFLFLLFTLLQRAYPAISKQFNLFGGGSVIVV